MIDKRDAQILNILQKYAKTSYGEIAKEVGMVPSGILDRIRRLEKKGLITGFHAHVDGPKVGFGLTAFVSIYTTAVNFSDKVAQKIGDHPNVTEVHEMAGKEAYFVKVMCRDTNHLSEILKTHFSSIQGITSTSTRIVLNTAKDTSILPVSA